jgi:hypothetical protein
MARRRALRAIPVFVLAAALLLLLEAPICSSSACPMKAGGRAICLAVGTMGMDCCQGASGHLAPSPAGALQPDLALAAAGSLTAPAPSGSLPVSPRQDAPAAPAIVQGVGLFTLFAVFLI